MNVPERFLLQRLDHTEYATYGQLLDAEGKQICVTLELPWRYNVRDESCIVPGTYRGFLRKSAKRGYKVYELLAVPSRTHIEIHVGNTTADSQGCILVGSHFGDINGAKGVLESKAAFAEWMRATRGAEYITLDVKAPIVDEFQP